MTSPEDDGRTTGPDVPDTDSPRPDSPQTDQQTTPVGTDTPDTPDTTDAPATPSPATRRQALIAGGVGLGALILIPGLTSPRPQRLGAVSGDQDLAEALRPHLDGHSRVAATIVDPDQGSRFAGFDTDEGGEFEIGSVTKTFTGLLLAIGVEKGEVTLETTVADVLGERASGSAIADVTLAELATHSSGLPGFAPGNYPRIVISNFLRKDPHGFRNAEEIIDDALAQKPKNRGKENYSNLGVGLLGQLLAKAAGTDYRSLLQQRVFDQMGLSFTYCPITADQIKPSAPRGRNKSGLPSGPWPMGGLAPAGGIRSTPGDMTVYLTGMLDGSSPGHAATTEVLRPGKKRDYAMLWIREKFGTDHSIVWHNGMTGGYAAFCGYNEDTGRGVVLMSATSRSLDSLAVKILTGKVEL